MRLNVIFFILLFCNSTYIMAAEIVGAFGFKLGEITSVDGHIPTDGKPIYVKPTKPMREFTEYWVVLTPTKGRIAEIGARGWNSKNCKDDLDRLSTILFQKYGRRPSEDRLIDRFTDFAKYDRKVDARPYGKHPHFNVRVDNKEARLKCELSTGELSIEYWDYDMRRVVNSESVETTDHSL